ncbi:metallophosphoesterase [Saccharicrinis aurantiacus]|uniref:metallophosphoesterase n=1 Tax=Saccharicrinis aurantiacus TaxID=1849719 RepID=UPI00094F973E|nr:metallophosphoesterase [Saccharicrinis aurantiacus]
MKFIPYLIPIGFLSLLIVSVIYLARKWSWIMGADSTTWFYVFFAVVPVLFMVGLIKNINAVDYTGHAFYKIASVAMGLYLFITMAFLAVDLVALFIKLKPMQFGILSFTLFSVLALGSYFNAQYLRTSNYKVPLKGLSQTINSVHLTDIHIGHFRNNGFLNKLVKQTNAQNPDVIFITGDYLDSKYALNSSHFEPLQNLKAPVYFVDGNHDHATDNDSILAMMRSAGVNVLQNEIAQFKDLQIIGLEHMVADRETFDVHASPGKPTIRETLNRLPIKSDKPSVILHHAPNGIKHAEAHGVDLYLAGHTHGGQIFPFNYVSNLMFEYNSGMNIYKSLKVFVSEGIGTFGPPFRLGTKSELVNLQLIPTE